MLKLIHSIEYLQSNPPKFALLAGCAIGLIQFAVFYATNSKRTKNEIRNYRSNNPHTRRRIGANLRNLSIR